MDVVAHALWANLAAEVVTRRTRTPLTKERRVNAMVGSVLPDLLAFAPYFVISLFGTGGLFRYAWFRFRQEWSGPIVSDAGIIASLAPVLPPWMHELYSYTHSALVWLVLGLVLYAALKRVSFWWIGWGTHIALDVFTHDAAHFPTKLLFPLSDFHINATAWSNPVVFACTYVALLLCYLAVYTRRRTTA
jgi:hypothetical protein